MAEEARMTLWQPDRDIELPKGVMLPSEIVPHAQQLSKKTKEQIVAAFGNEHYEMGLNYLWAKTMAALKHELGNVGIELLGEMLGRVDVQEDDDVDEMLTERDAIRLARELGVVTDTGAMRLRHAHETVTHFNRVNVDEEEQEEIDATEAVAALKNCVKYVLGKPRIEIAKRFVEFRKSIETKNIGTDDEELTELVASPYFFAKLTINILMNSIKTAVGAKLEHCLTNANVVLPALWDRLADAEKWRVGQTYADVYSAGRRTAMAGLKQALLKVAGFDFVPENLRSNTFIKAAEDVLKAHDGWDNFYNEVRPVTRLSRLGTSIPTPALAAGVTALLAVYLGNAYGVSHAAVAVASGVLEKLGEERWRFYLDEVLPGEERILNKLACDVKPRKRWSLAVATFGLSALQLKGREIVRLVDAGTKDSDRYKVFNLVGVTVCNSIPRETHRGPARVRPSVPWSP